MSKRTLITAALPYANGPVHIGHLAGCYLPSDIYARYLRMRGDDVVFVCGSDEHGVPITIKARNEGISPQEVVDRYHALMKKAFDGLGISFDVYSRTSSKAHRETASDFFKTLYDKGVFEERITEQYFDESANQFLADRYITGTCPKCNAEGAYGDQCESCGASLSSTDLINPVSTLSGGKPVLKSTKNWFLPLQNHQSSLESFISQKKGDWKTNVYGQCMSWLKQGLQPRAMTRDLNWGVPVPVNDAEGKVLYVWFDAPIGYITATKELLGDRWEDYWKGDDARIVHFIGKDNIVFHCIIFPAMLMAHGGFNLPDNVPANEFLNLEGRKISTSRNWAVWLHEYIEDFPDRQDELRYVLTSIAPETSDSEFTWSDFQARVNNELVAILGNLVNRVMVLYHKYFDGETTDAIASFNDIRHNTVIEEAYESVASHIEGYRFKQGLIAAMEVARHGNRYLTETEPWKLFKTDRDGTRIILNDCLLLINQIRVLLNPFMPHTSQRLSNLLNVNDSMGATWKHDLTIPASHKLNTPSLLFSKVDDTAIEKQKSKLEKEDATGPDENQRTHSPIKDEISFEDFKKLDIRIGKILRAEKVKKADKLLKLTVDVGVREVTLVSGISEHYKAEDLPGQYATVLLNLQPRKIRGVLSQGMILMVKSDKGKLSFLQADDAVSEGDMIG